MRFSDLKPIDGTSNVVKDCIKKIDTTSKAFIELDIPVSMTYDEILLRAKEGSSYLFITRYRMKLDK